MIMEPSFGESVTLEDKILYIYAVARMPTRKLNRINSMKIVFFSKYRAYIKKEWIFRLKFMRHKRGPVSPHIYDIRKELKEDNLGFYEPERIYDENVSKQEESLSLNLDEVGIILDEIESLAAEIPWPFDEIDEVIDEYGKAEWQKRQTDVYDLKVNGKFIRDYKIKEEIPMPASSDFKIFEIPEKFKATFDDLFDPNKRHKIKASYEEDFCLLASMNSFPD
jgi:hypothetical protein